MLNINTLEGNRILQTGYGTLRTSDLSAPDGVRHGR
jgi:hypothetical protein